MFCSPSKLGTWARNVNYEARLLFPCYLQSLLEECDVARTMRDPRFYSELAVPFLFQFIYFLWFQTNYFAKTVEKRCRQWLVLLFNEGWEFCWFLNILWILNRYVLTDISEFLKHYLKFLNLIIQHFLKICYWKPWKQILD